MTRIRTAVGAIGAAVWLGAGATAQDGASFRARLSLVPVDAVTSRTTSGSGSATAVLVGNQVFMTGTFSGLSSPAVSAHLHQAPKGQRGPVVFALSVTKAASGVVGGSAELTSSQIQDLRQGRYYVQIHSAGNPEGEIRGWLFLQEAQP